jgi:hypothetical protein
MSEMASVNANPALYEGDPAHSRLQTALPTYEMTPEIPHDSQPADCLPCNQGPFCGWRFQLAGPHQWV